jgi:hypothetical protein
MKPLEVDSLRKLRINEPCHFQGPDKSGEIGDRFRSAGLKALILKGSKTA